MNKALFYVNSANRLSGTDGMFSYFFPLTWIIPFDRVVVLSANIPKTYYGVQANYNTFTIVEGSNQAIITIPPGTYTRTAFASCLASLLTSSSPSNFTYTITIPNTITGAETGKFTYIVSNNGSVQPHFVFIDNNINEPTGFYKNSTFTFSSNQLVSAAVCNFAVETCLFIHSDICYNELTQDNILQEIYTSGIGYNSYVSYTNFNAKLYSKKIMNKSQVYNFSLTDEFGTPLDLNGVNLTFTILLYCSSKFEPLVEKYIRYMTNKNNDGLLQENVD